jgi:hypothetical protein
MSVFVPYFITTSTTKSKYEFLTIQRVYKHFFLVFISIWIIIIKRYSETFLYQPIMFFGGYGFYPSTYFILLFPTVLFSFLFSILFVSLCWLYNRHLYC